MNAQNRLTRSDDCSKEKSDSGLSNTALGLIIGLSAFAVIVIVYINRDKLSNRVLHAGGANDENSLLPGRPRSEEVRLHMC